MYKRIIIFLIMAVLMLCACNSGNKTEQKGQDAPEKASLKEQVSVPAAESAFMPSPGVVLGVRRSGYTYERKYESTSGSIKIGGPVEYVNIVFERDIEPINASGLITIEGCENYKIDIVRNIVHIEVLGIENGVGIKLNIPSALKDKSGRGLKDDINLEISTPEWGAQTKYKLIGLENTLPMEDYKDESIELTSDSKKFILEFTRDVDRKSMEESIEMLLQQQGAGCSFKWISGKSLELSIKGLKAGEQDGTPVIYTINVEDAVDSEGRQVRNDMNFSSHSPNVLGYIDMNTKKNVELREFKDILYMAPQNYLIDKYVMLDNPAMRRVFDIEEKRFINRFNDEKIGFTWWNAIWLDGKTMLVYDTGNKEIYKHSTDGSIKDAIKLPFKSDDKQFTMMNLSPDGKRVALLYGNTLEAPSNPGDLYIITLDGRLLYKYTNITNLRTMKAYEWKPNMAWLDDSHIIIEDVTDKEKVKCGIIKVDITNGSRETVTADARAPVTMPGSNIMLAEKYYGRSTEPGDFIIMSGNNVVGNIKRNPGNSNEYCDVKNFIFLDSDRLVFNRNEDLVLYSINQKKEEVIGRGSIIGSSGSRDRVYYISNYTMLYTFY